MLDLEITPRDLPLTSNSENPAWFCWMFVSRGSLRPHKSPAPKPMPMGEIPFLRFQELDPEAHIFYRLPFRSPFLECRCHGCATRVSKRCSR